MSSIGILGGSFDPVHNGHLSIAQTAIKDYSLDKIILLPAKVSPFKIGKEMADTQHRINMLNLIAEHNDQFTVSTYEIENTGISYTYKTLCALKDRYKSDKLYFIMGTDSLVSLEAWYMGSKLLNEFSFIIGTRPGFNKNEVDETVEHYEKVFQADIKFLKNYALEVSSTEIKQRIKAGKSIDQLVPPCIAEYINEHDLYK